MWFPIVFSSALDKKGIIYIIFHAEIFNCEMSESFAVGDKISVKLSFKASIAPEPAPPHPPSLRPAPIGTINPYEMRQCDSSNCLK